MSLGFLGAIAGAIACNPQHTTARPPLDPSVDARGSGITALAFSPDGSVLAAVSQKGDVLLLDPENGAIRRTLHGDASAIRRVVFSSDGAAVAFGCDDKSVRLVDPKTGAAKGAFENLDARATSLALANDGKRLAVAMTLSELTEKEEVGPDGKRVHVRRPGPFGRLVVFDLGTQKPIVRKDLDAVPTDVAFSPDGGLAVGTREGAVQLLDESGATRSTLVGPSEVQQLVFSSDGRRVFAAAGVSVFAWKVTGEKLFDRSVPGTLFLAIDVSRDGAFVAAANSFAKAVVVSKADTGEVIATIHDESTPSSVAISPDGKTIASAGSDGKVKLWNPITGAPR